MTRRLTNVEFLTRYNNEVKNNKYYKPLTEYKTNRTDIIFEHLKEYGGCGKTFKCRPDNLWQYGIKCDCEKETLQKTHEQIIKEVYDKVGDEYTILGKYPGNNKIPIKFRHNCEKCNNHEFDMCTNNFLNSGQRCPKCFGTKQKTHEEFVKEVYDKVGDEYTILGKYIKAQGNIKIRHNCNRCNNHEWDANIQHFLAGSRCPECVKLNRKLEYEYIKNEICRLGLNDYELKSTEYIDNKVKLDIYHKKCGCISKISWNDFQKGTRCKCESEPKGETRIKYYLDNKNINYTWQYSDNTCKHILPLSFDFYIPHLKLLIEYDGSQHFSFQKHFHQIYENFELSLKRDQIKNQWCKDNKVSLIRISYKDFNNLEKILDDIFISDKKLHPKQYNSIYIYLSEKELLLETGIYKTLPKVEILNE